MAQAGFTPISLYYSTTAAAAPTAGNLANGELAINITDGLLYYKDNLGAVQVIASKAAAGGVTSFSAGTTGLTPNTATSGAVTLAGTLAPTNGGTGLTSLAAGSLVYGNGTSPFSTLAIGTSGQILTSNGTIPQWSNLSSVAVTTLSFGTTGLTPSTATGGAITVAGTLATTNGGTGLTTFTANGAVYATSTSALTTGTLPIASGGTGITAFGTGVQTALGQNVTGTGGIVLATNAALTTPTITNPTITNYTETLNTATGSTAINLATGTMQRITTSGSTTITLPASVAGKSFTVIVNYAGADALIWAGGSTLKWSNGVTPTPTSAAGKFDIFNFYQDGTNTYGSVFGQGF